MSDIETVLRTYPRVYFACRARQVEDPEGGPAVSAHQARVLSHLDDVDPTMVGELAEHVGVTISTMSLTLKRLEAAGYVRRDREETDRRVTNVRLTEAGVRVKDAESLLDPERVHRMLAELGASERRTALRGLILLGEAADALARRGVRGAEPKAGMVGRSKGGAL